MSAIPKKTMQSASHIETRGAIAALLGFFIIAGAECQRLWPTGTSLIYLIVCLPLLAIWVTHLAGWEPARRLAGMAIDGSIYILLVASLGAQFGLSPNPSGTLAATLLFWAPLIAAWWAWRYRAFSLKLAIIQGLLLVLLTWPFANDHQRLDKHAILTLSLVLLVRFLIKPSSLSAATPQNLDPTTGFPSAEYFEAELAQVAAISDRYNFPMSLIGCRLSPESGGREMLLQRYAEDVGNRLRTSDTACRWDTNTFIVLLPNTTETQAKVVAAGLLEAGKLADPEQHQKLIANIGIIQRIRGEDPMSTLTTLEHALSNPA